MHVVITGANGFVGQALAKHILLSGQLGENSVTQLTLLDQRLDPDFIQQARLLAAAHGVLLAAQQGDLTQTAWLAETLGRSTFDVLFHLASIPGGMAETDEALAHKVNIDATKTLLELAKAQNQTQQHTAVFVFASSIAVFGKMPEQVTDDTALQPLLNYGAHKVVGEVLVDYFTRRGWVKGRSLRLPGVLARPAAQTGQLSAFLSDIIRQLSQGNRFVCPMAPDAYTWASSLPNIVANLVHAAVVTPAKLQDRCTFTLPTLRFSMAELVTAIGEVYQQQTRELVQYAPNNSIQALFGAYPPLHTPAAEQAGFSHDGNLQQLVKRALAWH